MSKPPPDCVAPAEQHACCHPDCMPCVHGAETRGRFPARFAEALPIAREGASALKLPHSLSLRSQRAAASLPAPHIRSGHRANDWDVNKWLWQGQLKVQAQGNTLSVLLIDTTSGELFATCPATEANSKVWSPSIATSHLKPRSERSRRAKDGQDQLVPAWS